MGTVINVAAILLGGLCGLLFGKFIKERHQETLTRTCGVCVIFIGISGAMCGMMAIDEGQLISQNSMLVVGCLALGAFLGELLNIEAWFERFGEWLKRKTGNAKDKTFVDAFVTTSLTVCIGAMAIVGSIEDGLMGDYSVLVTKAILDLVMVMIMTCSLGKGSIFSAIPVAVFQGMITVLAQFLKPVMTDAAMANLSMTGSILIFCVGVNLVWGRKIRVANLLPGLIFAVAAAFLPI